MRCLEHRQYAEGVFQPSHTATCVLLSASGTEERNHSLISNKDYNEKKKKILKNTLDKPLQGCYLYLSQ